MRDAGAIATGLWDAACEWLLLLALVGICLLLMAWDRVRRLA